LNEEIRRYGTGVVDITEKARKARLRYYGHVIRRYEGERSDTLWRWRQRETEDGG
jgi:hypothetical protein